MKNTARFVKKMLTGSVMVATLLSAIPAQADNPPPTFKADAPNRYVVKKGDTLWHISGRYLESPARWREIWATNPQIKNPHLIYPGDILILCVIRGETMVGIDTGEGCAGVEKHVTGQVTQTPSVVVTDVANSIPAIPLSTIRHWLDKTVIVDPTNYEATPYVLASKNRNLLTAEGDKIYVKGVPLIVGQRYGVYREGQPYVDPLTNQVMGLEVTQVALGIVTDVTSNGISSLQLLKNYDKEVREGDRVFVELGNFVPPVFNLRPAQVSRGGRILRVMDSINYAGQGSVVSINLGALQGANPGDVLTVYRSGALVRDIRDDDATVRLPSEPAGNVMIFKTFDNISYAYVLDSTVPLDVGDKLLPPPYI